MHPLDFQSVLTPICVYELNIDIYFIALRVNINVFLGYQPVNTSVVVLYLYMSMNIYFITLCTNKFLKLYIKHTVGGLETDRSCCFIYLLSH
jgi:hypothetical protein